MNDQKTKKSKSHSHHKSPQRRVSFSKPWTPTDWPRDVNSRHGSKDSKAHPVPRGVSSRSILAKPSLKLDKTHSINKGVCARIKKRDASSSTAVDTKRRSQSDPTPAHLKYGMFRRFSKLRKQSDIIDVSPPTSPRESSEIKPILPGPARSSVFRPNSTAKVHELPSIKGSVVRPSISYVPPSPPPRPQTKHVNLSRTEPIHFDIKPKRFPSMLWC